MAQETQSGLTQDELFDLLSQQRRRYLLRHLIEADDPVEFDTLTREIAAWENDKPVEEITEQERKRVYVSLYQTHLPKLEDAGVIEYDSDAGVVKLTDWVPTSHFGGMFQAEQPERPWPLYFLSVSLVSTILYGAITLNAGPAAAIPDAWFAGVVLLVFLGLVAAYLVNVR